jgi:hypothetical protein
VTIPVPYLLIVLSFREPCRLQLREVVPTCPHYLFAGASERSLYLNPNNHSYVSVLASLYFHTKLEVPYLCSPSDVSLNSAKAETRIRIYLQILVYMMCMIVIYYWVIY